MRDRAALERNFREKFETLNRVRLTDSEFQHLLDELVTPDVFTAARLIREKNDFIRDDGTPLAYTLVNIKDWCKNDFEVIHQLRVNTDYSHHRYDVILLINGVPVVQVELKTLGVNPRRAMEQIVEYKNDLGNGLGAGQSLSRATNISNLQRTSRCPRRKSAVVQHGFRGAARMDMTEAIWSSPKSFP